MQTNSRDELEKEVRKRVIGKIADAILAAVDAHVGRVIGEDEDVHTAYEHGGPELENEARAHNDLRYEQRRRAGIEQEGVEK